MSADITGRWQARSRCSFRKQSTVQRFQQQTSLRLQAVLAALTARHLLQLGNEFLPELNTHPALYKWWIASRHVNLQTKMAVHPHSYSAYDALPLPSASIDVLLISHLLETTQYPERILYEAWRVLSENGCLLVIGFNQGYLRRWCSLTSLSKRFLRKSAKENLTPYDYNTDKLRQWIVRHDGIVTHCEQICVGRIGSMYQASGITQVFKPFKWLGPLLEYMLPGRHRIYLIVAQKRTQALTRLQLPVTWPVFKLNKEGVRAC